MMVTLRLDDLQRLGAIIDEIPYKHAARLLQFVQEIQRRQAAEEAAAKPAPAEAPPPAPVAQPNGADAHA